MTMLQMYILIKLTYIQNMLLITSGIIFVCGFFCLINIDDWKDETKKRLKKFNLIVQPLACILLLISILIPNTQQMAVIYLVPKIANNEKVQTLAIDGSDILMEYVKQWKEQIIEDTKQKLNDIKK